jgi:type IV pilus assembly protein PilY1
MVLPAFATRMRRTLVAAGVAAMAPWTLAATPLADQPVFTNSQVPGNLALALSVEYPTAVSVAHIAGYASSNTYLGYFDPNKCYLYHFSVVESDRHFYPAGAATGRECTGTDNSKWSGNFLNWATMQTADPFRWALTGGYRARDTTTETYLEKTWASGQGGTLYFPDRTITNTSVIANATPFSGSQFRMRIQGLGNKMRFTDHLGNVNAAATAYDPAGTMMPGATYEVSVRVKVCDASPSAGPVEANCTPYPAGNYKPTGLIQQYAEQIRFSAFGYLNIPDWGDISRLRDGGVLRAQQKFVGPQKPVPGGSPVANEQSEWDANTGVMVTNPDAADASNTAAAFGVPVSNSGVMNYLNKFGNFSNVYKVFDPVGELYYTALRYFKKLGNVPEYTAMDGQSTATKATWVDGFPVITNWADPIQYSCQKNFILGIGDVNTHADRNLPGATGGSEPSKPSLVTADTTVDALLATNKVGALHGIGAIGATQNYGGCCSNNGALMAGLAYDANTKDIRPDDPSDLTRTKGRQTVQTYWLDILEYSFFKANNQFYLAAKYGGFSVPETFDPYAITTDIPESWWYTNTDIVGGQKRPDTYFTADRPDLVVAGLTKAFAGIASRLKATTTSFSTYQPQITSTGTASFATQFDSKNWSGEVVATKLAITGGAPTSTEAWRFSTKLDAQGAGTGWDTGRVIASYNTATSVGVPFRSNKLSAAQVLALDTAYRSGDDSADYLNYLRGDRTHEKSSTVSGSARAYRDRATLLGDIVNSKSRPVGPPSARYSSAANPGYSTFKSSYSTRKTIVYVGTNLGMLHAIDGSADSTGGQEIFAYVPSALYEGPTATPQTNGLQALGNPEFTHYNFVDATPVSADVDLGKTVGGSGTNWRTILVGGLGKGGRSLYALDVTDPSTMTSETAVASRVLWEFSDADLGFTYGEPAIVKTKKYGWVVVFASGYNNADGKGYFFIVNPRNGALLEKIGTGAGSTGDPAGMAHVRAFLLDVTDGTADAVYAGDLHGNLWRLDVTASSGSYPAPTKLAQLTDSLGNRLPVTSRPLIIPQPGTNRRYVTVGTGRLLHSSDSASAQAQRYFAIIDGTGARFNKSTDLPSGITFPITTSKLKQLTNLTQKVTFDLTQQIGWFVDLGQVAGGAGWRVISDSSSRNGIVAFSAMVPASDSVCEPTGTSRVYAIDLGTGASRLLSPSGTVISYNDSLGGVITDMAFFGDGNISGEKYFIVGNDSGKVQRLDIDLGATSRLRRLNWREVPLAD